MSFFKVYTELLRKEINGVVLDEALIVFWVALHSRREHFKNDRETLESLCKVLKRDRFSGARLLEKLLASGVVQAELVVKNAGVKKGNEAKAPKRWRFIEIDNPEDYVKGKPKKAPKLPTSASPKPAPKQYIPELGVDNTYDDDDCPF